MKKTLVVLAAGIGSRYGGLKQMDPMGPSGEFIVDYTAFDAIRAGFTRIVFVIRRDIEEAFKSSIGERVGKHVETEYVMQEVTKTPDWFKVPAERKKPWGTGQAVLVCSDAVKEPFGMVNADDFYGRESYEKLAGFLDDTAARDNDYCMVGFVLRNTLSDHGSVARGICRAGKGGLLESAEENLKIYREGSAVISETPGGKIRLTGEELVSMNMWGFKTSLFPHLSKAFGEFLKKEGNSIKSEYLIPTVINDLIRSGSASVRVIGTESSWMGITNPQDKAPVVEKINALINRGEYPKSLWG